MSKAYIKKENEKKRHEVTISVLKSASGGKLRAYIKTNAEHGELGREPMAAHCSMGFSLGHGESVTIVIED